MRKNKWFWLLISTLLVQSFWSQQLNNSPYTRYGLGEIISPNTSSPFGMGGLATPLSDYRYVNVQNPASYSSLIKNNPIFDVGIAAKFSTLKTDAEKSTYSNAGLRNFILALPLAKKWGLAFGLMPYSTSGYSISDNSLLDGDTITNSYAGDGSLNRVFIGNGVNLINKGDTLKFSVGANASFIFGTLERERSVIFDNTTYLNAKVKNRDVINGAMFDAGMHFYQKVNKNISWQFGATFGFNSSLNISQDFYAYTFKTDTYYNQTVKDTIAFNENQKGKITTPRTFSTGMAVSYKKWMVGFQYNINNWQQYKEVINDVDVTEFTLKQSDKLIIGVEYHPKTDYNNKNKNILQKSIYRFGFNYGKTAIQIDSTRLKQYGMSFGTSMPLISSRSLSMVNLGVEFGKMGTMSSGLIQDNYFKVFLGFSLSPAIHDRWFVKRKYD